MNMKYDIVSCYYFYFISDKFLRIGNFIFMFFLFVFYESYVIK